MGYEISPILWRKIKWGLSAGRVQSVALRIICDREKDINDFESKEYWTIECNLNKNGDNKSFIVKLMSNNSKKVEIANEDESKGIINELENGKFLVKKIKNSSKTKNPLPPFITSTLQQDAYKKLNYSTKRTMSIAQQLYEGVDVKGHGATGLITYMRTDSVRIASEAQDSARKFVVEKYGDSYIPESPRVFKGKKNIQDAHEAIRPTYVELTPNSIKNDLKPEQYKLYNLIWNRYLASQMASCILNTTSIDVANGTYILKASDSSISFDGFMKVYDYTTDEDVEKTSFPELAQDEELRKKDIEGKQHFTQPPANFSEGTLVKTLEDNGIGRPSTYAPTLSTLLGRKYVEREKKTLKPTELGIIVNNIVSEYFKQIVDVEFTAEMEDRLDNVEEGKETWNNIVDEFFKPLKIAIDVAEKEISKITIEDKVTEIECDKCGKFMVIKHGRFGDFLACPGYPECKNTKPIVEELNVDCPKCDGKVLVRRSKKGRKFFGCSNYPNCDYVSWFEPVEEKCPDCNSLMWKKFNKTKGTFYECSNPECKHIEYKKEEEEQ